MEYKLILWCICRCFFNLQWPLLGRCGEIGKLSWKDFVWVISSSVNCMKTTIKRVKVGDVQELHVFLHAFDIYSCPIHSLACQIVLCPTTNPLVFPEIVEGDGGVKHMNALLKILYDLWVARSNDLSELDNEDCPFGFEFYKYTSHDSRRSAVNDAALNADIPLSSVALRGGWSLGKEQTIFNYLMGICPSDVKVGRVLSGWSSPNEGGYAPGKLLCFI